MGFCFFGLFIPTLLHINSRVVSETLNLNENGRTSELL